MAHFFLLFFVWPVALGLDLGEVFFPAKTANQNSLFLFTRSLTETYAGLFPSSILSSTAATK